MPVPKNQKELLQQSEEGFEKLHDLIESFSPKKQGSDFVPGTMNRNIRDVLAHLHHWHLMLLNWYEVGMNGEKPDMPAKGYTWKDTKQLNRDIWKLHQKDSLQKVKKALSDSHEKVHGLISKHTEDELFEKKRYAWTGSSSLATYLRASTSSHYRWAYNLIRRSSKSV